MRRLFFLLLILLLAACNMPAATGGVPGTQSPVVEPQSSLTPSVTVQPSYTPRPTHTPQPTPTAIPPRRSQYALTVTYNQKEQRLTVAETLTYVNWSGVELPDLRFVVEPNRAAGQFKLESVTWSDGRPVEGYALQDALLSVPLENPLQPLRSVGVRINYELRLPNAKGIFGYTPSQASLADWYPFVPPYLPEKGWLIHDPGNVGEYLAYDMADYWVNLKLEDFTPGTLIAANAPAEISGDGMTYTFLLRNARHFVWTALMAHELQMSSVDGVLIYQYVYPRHADSGAWVLEVAQKSLQFYNQQFGPYPHESLTIIETDMFDGMEYDGLYFLSQGYYDGHKYGAMQDYLTTLTAHEIGHQWWFAQVGNDAALEPWLDEALCAYTEYLFYENYYPGLLDWWWDFRVDSFAPTGYVNDTIYEHYNFRIYVNAIYLQGARFLHELRGAVGDEAFLAFLKDYLQTYSGKVADAAGFFTVLARHSDVDLSALRAKYFK